VEILKYAFVLRLSLRRVSEAEKLENLVNDLYGNTINVETVIQPILRLLMELKSFQTDTGAILVLVLSSIIQSIINLLRSTIFIEARANLTLYSL